MIENEPSSPGLMGPVGERWSIAIIRELLLGPRRFSDIRRGLPGLSANVLTQRLESLERQGILRRGLLPALGTVQVYGLTRWGSAAEGAILALDRWSASSPAQQPAPQLSSTAFMMSLKALANVETGQLLNLEFGFQVGGEPYRVTVAVGGLVIIRADTAGVPIVFGGDPNGLDATFFGPQTLTQSQMAGRVAVAGNLPTAQAFVDLFTVPTFSND